MTEHYSLWLVVASRNIKPEQKEAIRQKFEKNVVRNNTINRTVVGGDDFGSLFSRGFVPHRTLLFKTHQREKNTNKY